MKKKCCSPFKLWLAQTVYYGFMSALVVAAGVLLYWLVAGAFGFYGQSAAKLAHIMCGTGAFIAVFYAACCAEDYIKRCGK